MKEYKDMILFLAGSFLIPLAALALQYIIRNEMICFVLYGIQAASPTISAAAVLCGNGTLKKRSRELFRREHIIKALLLPPAISGVTMFSAKALSCAVGGVPFSFGKIPAGKLIVIMWALIAEEPGWRGFLEPELIKYGVRRSAAPFITGTIWCMWHYHFFLLNGMEVPLPLFFAGCLTESCIYSFLMEMTGNNILSAMMYHFSWNLFLHAAAVAPSDCGGSTLPYIIAVIIEVLPVAAAAVYGKKHTNKELP